MPIYQFHCPRCDTVVDKFRSMSGRDETTPCDVCGDPMRRQMSYAMQLVGATPSRPIDMTKQLGRVFETNQQYRDYLANNAVREVDKASFRPRLDAAKERKERIAQSQGFRSWRHRTEELKKKAKMDGG